MTNAYTQQGKDLLMTNAYTQQDKGLPTTEITLLR